MCLHSRLIQYTLPLTSWPLTSLASHLPIHQRLQEINSMIRTGESPGSRKRSMALEDEVSAKRVCADNHSALLRRLQDVANDRSSSRWPCFLEEANEENHDNWLVDGHAPFLPECVLLRSSIFLFLLTWSFWHRLTDSSPSAQFRSLHSSLVTLRSN